MNTYLINTDTVGLEVEPKKFILFCEFCKERVENLFEWSRPTDKSNLFEIKLLGDTSLFQLGMMYKSWADLNSEDEDDFTEVFYEDED